MCQRENKVEKYINKIINADCMEILKQLPDKCIDLVLTDPPYNIAIAKWDKWKRQEDYINWLGGVFKECQRVLKDNGSFYFFHNDFLQIVEIQNFLNKNTNFIFKQFITWNKKFRGSKNEGFLQGYNEIENLRNYQKFAEYCLFYTFQDETGLERVKEVMPNPFAQYLTKEFQKAKVTRKEIAKLFPSKTGGLTGCVSNWLNGDSIITKEQYLKIKNYLGKDYFKREYEDLRKEYEDLRYTFNNQKTHHSVWNYDIAKKQFNEHLTPKPIPLIENILKYSSNENGLVLDCFSGSGTTAIACRNLNRRFICIEKDKDYYEKSVERLNNAKAQLKLF